MVPFFYGRMEGSGRIETRIVRASKKQASSFFSSIYFPCFDPKNACLRSNLYKFSGEHACSRNPPRCCVQ